MEEQLISFETAKLAKKKGFNIRCRNWFGGNGSEQDSTSYDTVFYWHKNYPYNFESPESHGYSRPTQSLLQKWLREKHNIHIEINGMNRQLPFNHCYYIILRGINFELILDNESDGNWYPILSNRHNNDESTGYMVFDTFEEALEIGLQEALELVDNGK